MAHLALVDHHMVPDRSDVGRWGAIARERGFRSVRTSALFAASAAPFLDEGFVVVDRLALLEADLTGRPTRRPTRRPRTRRLRARDLALAAEIDRRAFGDGWSNDATSLDEIRTATPSHRSRVVGTDPVVGFAISGRAGRTGYLQRLAVDPEHQGRGLGRALVVDSIGWMRRHAVARALVNTGVDNQAALRLYLSEGFVVRPDELTVLERPLT